MNIALIGYGEVGQILAEDLAAAGHAVTAFDLKQRSEAVVPLRAHALIHSVDLAKSHTTADCSMSNAASMRASRSFAANSARSRSGAIAESLGASGTCPRPPRTRDGRSEAWRVVAELRTLRCAMLVLSLGR